MIQFIVSFTAQGQEIQIGSFASQKDAHRWAEQELQAVPNVSKYTVQSVVSSHYWPAIKDQLVNRKTPMSREFAFGDYNGA